MSVELVEEFTSEAAEQLARLLEEEASGAVPPRPWRERLALDEITLVPELFQPRNMSEKHISDLVRIIDASGEVDPVTVLQLPGKVVLVDGHHRHAAYRRARKAPKAIPVGYFEGSLKEAVLAAGEANSKAKLPMTSRERQDYAWRLEVLGSYSIAQISRASGASKSQVANMRKVRKQLGSDAGLCRTWWEARRRADGIHGEVMSDDDRELWMKEQAERYADALVRQFSTRLSRNPEVAAMALEIYFGRKLPEVVRELRGRVPDDDIDWDF